MNFAHLHVHSDASKDGLRPVDQLVKAAYEKGFGALALTDHGTLSNAVSFSLAAKSMGVKPIVGLEAYVDYDGKVGHITLLGNGQLGLENLIRLNNLGHAREGGKAPSFSLDALLADCKHLICLSGCVASPFHNLPFSEATSLMSRFKHAFSNRFFIETMFVADIDTWSRPLKLAEKGGVPLVITNDTHFPLYEDAETHSLVTQMRAGYSYSSRELWLKGTEQIWLRAKSHITRAVFDDAISNSSMIANKIKATEFNNEPTLPHIDNAEDLLMRLVNESGIRKKGSEYDKRTKYELGIINKMGYASYFVILHDIVNQARKLGAYIGPGRGSGAGSLVLFSLGITQIDPIVYDLPFERFLNPERKGMPDVDVDIDSVHRDEVIAYVAKKWKGTPIGTVIRYSHKTAVHDLAKALRIPRDVEAAAADAGLESPEMVKMIEGYPEFERAYNTILGQIRHRGRHPAGIVITDRSIPIERASGNLVAAWTEGKFNEMSKAGIVKYDLLGLEALTILQTLERNKSKVVVAKSKLHVDDDPAFELFRKGDVSGIFQFSGSDGIRLLTMKLKPDKFEDLIALNALYRPGTLDAGTADKFVEWRFAPRKVPTIVEDILSPTYGAIVYQEQVMALYARMTKGSLSEADNIRRLIVKASNKMDDPEWQKQFSEAHTKFIKGAKSQGIKEPIAESIWKEIETHSRYSFNKAHATAYAQIAWQMAWWKWYYPVEFYAAMMSSDRENITKYVFDGARHGIVIKMPHINNIGANDSFTVDGNSIIVPANVIKYVTNVEPIRAELKNGPFTSIADFVKRMPKAALRGQARAALYGIGAFKGLKGSPKDLGLSPKALDNLNELKKATNPVRAAQIQLLGFFVPDAEDVEKIEVAKAEGLVAGILGSFKDKKSTWGAYRVFYLIPSGVFWSRGLKVDSLKVGDIVAATTKSASGKATKIRKL